VTASTDRSFRFVDVSGDLVQNCEPEPNLEAEFFKHLFLLFATESRTALLILFTA
jgi:hypothetical protein